MNIFFRSKIILIPLTFVILLTTLYFGFQLRGFRLENHVSYLLDEPGIHFKRFGIAYAKIGNPVKFSSLKEFTIEIALKPEKSRTYGFNIIMAVHDGKDADQLIVGQWQSHVIIMNGDDYSNKRKLKRISAEIFKKPYKKMMLTVTTGEKGTDLFVNGELIKSRSDLALKIPTNEEPLLTMGNSVYGNNSWNGNIYGFALYDHRLQNEKIESHYKIWKDTSKYDTISEENPLLLFDFNETNKIESTTYDKDSFALNIPVYFPVLKKTVLQAPWKGVGLNESSIKDITINLIGFIPLGFILYALFSNLFKMPQNKIILFAVLACFLVSLFIEIAQAWIPSRSSQSLDLILNTAGGWMGAAVAMRLSRRSVKIDQVGNY